MALVVGFAIALGAALWVLLPLLRGRRAERGGSCAECDAPLESGARFCAECGAPVAG